MSTLIEALPPLDSFVLHLESPRTRMHSGFVGIVEARHSATHRDGFACTTSGPESRVACTWCRSCANAFASPSWARRHPCVPMTPTSEQWSGAPTPAIWTIRQHQPGSENAPSA